MENSHRISKQIKPVGQIKKFSRGRSNFWRNEIWFLLLNWFVAFLCAEYNKQLVTKGQLICMQIEASTGKMTTQLQDSKSMRKLASFRSCPSEPGDLLCLILAPSWTTMGDIFLRNLKHQLKWVVGVILSCIYLLELVQSASLTMDAPVLVMGEGWDI